MNSLISNAHIWAEKGKQCYCVWLCSAYSYTPLWVQQRGLGDWLNIRGLRLSVSSLNSSEEEMGYIVYYKDGCCLLVQSTESHGLLQINSPLFPIPFFHNFLGMNMETRDLHCCTQLYYNHTGKHSRTHELEVVFDNWEASWASVFLTLSTYHVKPFLIRTPR